MLFAILKPGALVGLFVAFLLALTLRLVATRLVGRALGVLDRRTPLRPDPRADVDPFGAVAAAIAGTGWGRPVDIDAMPRWVGRGRKLATVAAGVLAPLLVGLAVLTAYTLLYPNALLFLDSAGEALRGGWAPSFLAQLIMSVALGLICFALLNLVPLPPLDGFALLWLSMRHIGAAGERARGWLVQNNIGVVIVLLLVFFPFQYPLIYLFIDLLAAPVLWIWQ